LAPILAITIYGMFTNIANNNILEKFGILCKKLLSSYQVMHRCIIIRNLQFLIETRPATLFEKAFKESYFRMTRRASFYLHNKYKLIESFTLV